ncbi:hypothetical protein CKAN_01053200 [Cinnamomum micranthum f. kanehirae]|uniref:Uncharacterized protein n=1 Tax=Cinnamomum micranthum f. kanehirae TaxID=337451 RepID=A0A3S3MY85_9MAGN|nr:hypothetical protein CKAN_01053200 [Cinnamomum micranthum f. kanehirae]
MGSGPSQAQLAREAQAQARPSSGCARVVVTPPWSRSSLLHKSGMPLGAHLILPRTVEPKISTGYRRSLTHLYLQFPLLPAHTLCHPILFKFRPDPGSYTPGSLRPTTGVIVQLKEKIEREREREREWEEAEAKE